MLWRPCNVESRRARLQPLGPNVIKRLSVLQQITVAMSSFSGQRIGVFGGSFDPIHLGHLILAESCREQVQLDKVLFVPAAQSPAKTDRPVATDRQRQEMLALAIAGHPNFMISTLEIDRGGTSYTVDTLSELAGQQPDDQLFLIIGQDSLDSFAAWRQPETICQLATPLVVSRSADAIDFSLLDEFLSPEKLKIAESSSIQNRWIDISSTDIRDRVADGKSIRYLVPRGVEKYIETNGLYAAAE